jgi:hypothetical protein
LLTILPKCLTVLQGFAIPKETQNKVAKFSFHGEPAELKHGSVVIAAITSCTNTSNPSVMLGAGLVAKKACELGLQVSYGYVFTFHWKKLPSNSFSPSVFPIWNIQLLLAFLLL